VQPLKQLIMLDEIALFSSFIAEDWIVECVHIICPQLLFTTGGPNSSVAEKALSMGEVNDFVWFMTTNPGVTFPIVLPKIYDVAKFEWNPEIRVIAMAFDIVGTNMVKIQSLELIRGACMASRWMYLIANLEENQRMRRAKMHMLPRLFEGAGRIVRAKKPPEQRPPGNEEGS
jgi:hypothetical protein